MKIVGVIVLFLVILGYAAVQKTANLDTGTGVNLEKNFPLSSLTIRPMSTPEKTAAFTKEPIPTPSNTPPPTPRKISYTSTGVYNVGEEQWESIVIPPDSTKEEVVALAIELHEKNPKIHYNIFNDNREIAAYKRWEISKNNPSVYFPEDWDREHNVGMINEMLTENGVKWQFYSDSERYLGSFDLE